MTLLMAESEFNPYQSSDTSDISLEQQLIAEQNYLGTLLGAIIGAIPGFIIYLWLVSYPFFAVLAYFVPGLFIGFFSSFMGRGIDKIHRFSAAFVAIVCVSLVGWWFELSSIAIGLSLINGVVAAMISGRRLSREEDDALFNYKIGYQPKSKR